VRRLRDAAGALIQPTPPFRALRDRTPDPLIDARRASFESIFSALGAAGVAREDLQLVFYFTAGTLKLQEGWMLRMRDAAFDLIDKGLVTVRVNQIIDNVAPNISRKIVGDFDTPCFLSLSCARGGVITPGPDGFPTIQSRTVAEFVVLVPPSVWEGGVPSRAVQYGHGVLSDVAEMEGGYLTAAAQRDG
jgi:hypothetical protein